MIDLTTEDDPEHEADPQAGSWHFRRYALKRRLDAEQIFDHVKGPTLPT